MSGIESLAEIQKKIDDIALHIVKEHSKGKIPLFVIGAGISTELKIPEELKGKVEKIGIPNMDEMIKTLHSLYEEYKNNGNIIPDSDREDIEKRFKIWELERGKKVDRSNVGGILGYFQGKKYLKEVWIDFNKWLLNRCVNEDEKIGIINARPSKAHGKIAELYEKVNAFCLTTNFDGLLFKALQSKYDKKKTYSYYTREHAIRFFTAETSWKNDYFAEIQVRGDIFFVKCDSIWCDKYNICEYRSTTPTRIWESELDPLVCKREMYMKPFISFPGTHEKDKEVREILSVLWQYLTHKVSCVITIGIGGWWDPILVAFLSDLVRERDIHFIDANISPEGSCIRKEIIDPDISGKRSSLKISANQFTDILIKSIEQAIENIQKGPKIKIEHKNDDASDDRFWAEILKDWRISDFEKALVRHPLVEITSKFAQLGLKSKWWGIPSESRWRHNRLNHSKGVMKIATFLYEKACKNSGRPQREEEKQFLRIAALLHDIGHLPFSHLIEEVFQELNWKPGGYTGSFSHDYYTEEKVRKIFEDAILGKQLGEIGYTVGDLIRLIRGEFGIGFLDAIINGPIDADKIDYVFRDAASIDFSHRINTKEFLEDMKEGVSISPMGLLVLKGNSVKAAVTILEQRESLYKNFYLSSAIKLLEKAIKLIIITYFVHTYNTDQINTLQILENIKSKFLDDKNQFPDLGAIRIAMATEELESLAKKYSGEPDIEMKIVCHMKENLDKKPIDKKVKEAINVCFSLIKNTNQEYDHNFLNLKRERIKDFSQFSRESFEKIRYDAKTVSLRFPGAILIEVLPPFEFFKIAEARKQKPRSDGTNVQSECILSPELFPIINDDRTGKERKQRQINIYKIGEESEVNRALGLLERLIREEKRLVEVE